MLKNYEILKIVGEALGRDKIIIAVRSYNINSKKLEGCQIHIFSDKESGITLYSNGVVISGQYNPIKGQGSIKFVLNPKYNSPWVSSNNYIDANEIKMEVDMLIEKNPCIMKKHEAVKLLIANYDDFITFCLKNKYMQVKQLNHTCTQRKYLEVDEIATAKNASEEVMADIEPLRNRELGMKYITFKPGSFYIEDCYGKIITSYENFYPKTFGGKTLKDLDISLTEKAFAKCVMNSFDSTHVILCSNTANFPKCDDRIIVKK